MKMKKYIIAICSLALIGTVQAGNPQRAGSAGASELLINPFARSAGWGGVNVAGVSGVDASFMNIAGIAATPGNTQVAFNNTQWLVGAGIQMNGATLIQRVSDVGFLNMGISAFDYGEWEVTTADQPEGCNNQSSKLSYQSWICAKIHRKHLRWRQRQNLQQLNIQLEYKWRLF